MEGVPILISDSNEGLCFPILEFLLEKKAIPFVFVKDFETVNEITESYEDAIPVVLNVLQNMESTIDHLSALPTISCVFNFDGEIFENLMRQTFDHFKTINIYKVDFNIDHVHTDILEAISEGYTLIINLIPLPLSGTTLLSTVDGPHGHDQILVLEKLFFRKMQPLRLPPPQKKPKPSQTQNVVKRTSRPASGRLNPFSFLFKKWFSRFNPCAVTPVLDLLPRAGVCPVMSLGVGIKSPQEINKYIKTQQANEIRNSFKVIHENANKNWKRKCEDNFCFTPEHQQQFHYMCEEIQRKGEEGRNSMMEKLNKDIERTRQYDHVLGDKAIDRIRLEKEKEIHMRVKQFCQRKTLEAKEQIDEDIRQTKIRGKGRFYTEILDEQVMELMRVKEKYQKRMELLMLPYTGELTILKKCHNAP